MKMEVCIKLMHEAQTLGMKLHFIINGNLSNNLLYLKVNQFN